MTVRPILVAPDKRLKLRSNPVEKVDAEIRSLLDDMLETMYAGDGLGLAAIQVSVPKRAIVIDVHATSLQRDGCRSDASFERSAGTYACASATLRLLRRGRAEHCIAKSARLGRRLYRGVAPHGFDSVRLRRCRDFTGRALLLDGLGSQELGLTSTLLLPLGAELRNGG